MILTIAIPTYNRIDRLISTVTKLLPQLNLNCKLIILDNCSTVPIEKALKEILLAYPKVDCTIIRNRVNVGADSNIMRCFEYCETQWLWTLGDDDEISDDAISIIFDDFDRHPDSIFINYNSPDELRPVRNLEVINCGKGDFLANMDSLGSLIYISCNVYQMKYLSPDAIWKANHNTYSCMAQWVVLINSLQDKSKTVFSNKQICSNPFVATGNEYVVLRVVKGLSTLLDIPMKKREKEVFISHLKKDIYRLGSIEATLKLLLIEYFNSGQDTDIIFQFKKLYFSTYRYLGISFRIKYFTYLISLIISKRISFEIIRKLYLKRKGIDINFFLR